jgi:hypothetical protein
MAGASAPERLTNSKRPTGAEWRPLSLEEVAEALQAIKPRTLRRDCLESRDRAYRWCVRKAIAEGHRFRATLTQAATGLGYPVTGDKTDDFNSFGKSVRRCLNDLQEAGLIQWGGITWPNGQWRCIEVCMPETPSKHSPSRHNHHYRALGPGAASASLPPCAYTTHSRGLAGPRVSQRGRRGGRGDAPDQRPHDRRRLRQLVALDLTQLETSRTDAGEGVAVAVAAIAEEAPRLFEAVLPLSEVGMAAANVL